jgi:hypothetical protein
VLQLLSPPAPVQVRVAAATSRPNNTPARKSSRAGKTCRLSTLEPGLNNLNTLFPLLVQELPLRTLLQRFRNNQLIGAADQCKLGLYPTNFLFGMETMRVITCTVNAHMTPDSGRVKGTYPNGTTLANAGAVRLSRRAPLLLAH